MMLRIFASRRPAELITRTYTLGQINEGYQDTRDGRNIRGVIRY